MDPTSLPTDNLYKFIALAGLGVAGFCVWFWWAKVHEHNREADEYVRRGSRLIRQQRQMRKRLSLPPGAAGQDDNALARRDELQIDIAELKADKTRLTGNVPKVEGLGKALVLGAFVSLLVSLGAFITWYEKLQQHLDASVVHGLREQKAKADLAELELKRAKAKP
ncbi:MAG TPA: hypothetical protein VHP33_17575 [Polyangiaceae bacterium]|nr:hypothetical protein [Polyangiaceae bacterium]